MPNKPVVVLFIKDVEFHNYLLQKSGNAIGDIVTF